MTATAPAPGARAERGNPGMPGLPEQQIAPPPKMRRRPAMIALSVACIAVGGLGAAFAWQATSNTNSVLTVRDTVLRGEVVTEQDVLEVQVGTDPAVTAIPAELKDQVIGRTAALDIAKGSVITPDQLTEAAVPAPGRSIVGVSLAAGLIPPGDQIKPGDRVRVITTSDTATGTEGAAVEGVIRGTDTDEVTGNTLASVEVASDEAVRVASAAVAGKVAVVLESQAGSDGTAPGTASEEGTGGGESSAPSGEGQSGEGQSDGGNGDGGNGEGA